MESSTLKINTSTSISFLSIFSIIIYILVCTYIIIKKKVIKESYNIDIQQYLFYTIFGMIAGFFLLLVIIFSNSGLFNSSLLTSYVGYLGLLIIIGIFIKFGIPLIQKYLPDLNLDLNSYTSIIITFIIAFCIIAFIFKQFNFDKPTRNSGTLFGLIYNIIFYVPCLLIDIIEYLRLQYAITPTTAYNIIIITILLLIVQFYHSNIQEYILYNDAVILRKDKIDTNYLQNMTTFQDINFVNDNIQYDYALSCMFNIHSFPSNIYSNYNENISLLNLGNQPNILYNAEENKLIITMKTDSTSNEIIFVKENINLQKWNHLVINYTEGTLDIFYNNRLVSSNPMVIPYQQYANVTIGQNRGIEGEMCNCYYFKKSLDKPSINNIYQYTKFLNNL